MVDMSAEAFEKYYGMWALWASTGKRNLPEAGGLSDQSTIEMQTILEIDSLYNKILEQVRDQKESEDAGRI